MYTCLYHSLLLHSLQLDTCVYHSLLLYACLYRMRAIQTSIHVCVCERKLIDVCLWCEEYVTFYTIFSVSVHSQIHACVHVCFTKNKTEKNWKKCTCAYVRGTWRLLWRHHHLLLCFHIDIDMCARVHLCAQNRIDMTWGTWLIHMFHDSLSHGTYEWAQNRIYMSWGERDQRPLWTH